MQEETFYPTAEDLQILREWIQQIKYIPQNYDDQYLSSFYRISKGRMQKTKTTLEFYCSAGYRFSEMCMDFNPERKGLQENLKQCYFYEIPKETSKHETIIGTSIRPVSIDPNKYNILEFVRISSISFMMNLKEKAPWSGKNILIIDCRGLSLGMLKEITPTRISFLIEALKAGCFGRCQAIHVLNVHPAVQWMFDLAKTLATEKIRQRLILHSKNEDLQKYIPKDLLPTEYGGESGTLEELTNQWIARMMRNKDFLVQEEENVRSLDYLRPKTTEGDMNLTDTFRKLNVD